MAIRPEAISRGWSFEPLAAAHRTAEPVIRRHPEAPGCWRNRFDPPLPTGWFSLDWAGADEGVVDARLILVFEDGTRLPQTMAKIGRNRCRALFSPAKPLAGLDLVLSGSSRPETWSAPTLREVSPWEQRLALLRRCIDVLRGDLKSLPWRAARFLIQVRRQGRTSIPITTLARSPAEAYAIWQARFDERDADRALHEARLAGLVRQPLFSVLADPDIEPDQARALAESLTRQVYGRWELFLPHIEAQAASQDGRLKAMPPGSTRAERLNAALAIAEGAFVFLPRPGTRLRAHALLVFALTLDAHPSAKLVSADDDDLGPEGRTNPRFKPAWSPTRALSWDYLGDPCCFDTALLRVVGGVSEAGRPAQRHDLLLKATRTLAAAQAVHIAQILSHTTSSPRASSTPEDRAIVRAHVERPGDALRVLADPRSPHPHVLHSIGDGPLVSIVIPTRDHADLLRLSVGSVKARTTYPAYEIIVVDNGSRDAETLRLFNDWAGDSAIRVIRDPAPFNYAGLNNRAVAQAKGSLVALVNNDIEVLDPLWLHEMVGLALQPGVGCVGAKLYYPDGRLQHGGVVTGVGGAAGHRNKRAGRDAAGMLDALVTVNEVSAVTAACLVVRKAVYDEVGGLDAGTFAVGYNDVDFCLKVVAAGYRNLWTPFAELTHHESVSRGRDLGPKTMERFNREVLALRLRWGERLPDDPYSSPNLTLDAEDGGIRVQ